MYIYIAFSYSIAITCCVENRKFRDYFSVSLNFASDFEVLLGVPLRVGLSVPSPRKLRAFLFYP